MSTVTFQMSCFNIE